MENILLVFISLFLGMAFRYLQIFPANAHLSFNRFVIYVSLPALTLLQMHKVQFSKELILPISMAWILFALGFLFFYSIDKFFQFPIKTKAALILTASLGNTSFVGLPLLEAYFGPQAIPYGILIDQPGTFMVAGTLGIAVAAFYSGKNLAWLAVLKKIFCFPPFIAILLSLALLKADFSPAIEHILARLGSTLAPVALFAVGLQIHVNKDALRRNGRNLCMGLGFKLILAPMFFLLLFGGIFQQRGELLAIEVVEAAMAPMITAGILVSEYSLDEELGMLMIGIGIPLSLVTTYAWKEIVYFLLPV